MIKIFDLAEIVVAKYKKAKQLSMAQEECAELIVAISHFKRGRRNAEAEVREEMADVAFMIYQLMVITKMTSAQMAEIIVKKYERLEKREEVKNA